MPETLQTYNTHGKKESLSERWLGERRKGRHRRTGRGIMAMLSRMHRSPAGHTESASAQPNVAPSTQQSYEQSLVSLQDRLRESAVSPIIRGVARPEAFAHDQNVGPDGSPRHLRQEQGQPADRLMTREPGAHYNPAEDASQMPQRDYDAHRIVQHDNGIVGHHRAPEPEPEASGWFAGSNTRR